MIPLRKPLTRKVLTRPAAHGYPPELVITLCPTGTAPIREPSSRPPPVTLDLALLYARRRLAEARASLTPRQTKRPPSPSARRAQPRR
jgi:hypothetical protein